MNILIAEDDPLIRRAYRRMLRGHLITAVGDAASAIEVLASGQGIEGVISDYHLEGGTGADIWAWVKEHRPELPFVLVTGQAHLDLDVPITILKPPRREDILRALGGTP